MVSALVTHSHTSTLRVLYACVLQPGLLHTLVPGVLVAGCSHLLHLLVDLYTSVGLDPRR